MDMNYAYVSGEPNTFYMDRLKLKAQAQLDVEHIFIDYQVLQVLIVLTVPEVTFG